MQQEDDFESAADSVSRQEKDEPKSVTIEYERRKYPNCPVGVWPAICVKAEIKDANPNGQFYKEGDQRIHLSWMVIEPTYNDDQGVKRNYRIFSRPLPISFGERSHMYKLWKKLTGTNIADFLVKTPSKINLGNGKMKDVLRITFEHKLLENMTANIIVDHQEYQGEMRQNLVDYMVTDEQKSKNFHQLPGMANAKQPIDTSTPVAPKPSPVNVTQNKVAREDLGATVNATRSNIDPSTIPF